MASIVREWIKRWLLKHDAVLSRPPGQFSASDYKLRKIRDRGLKVAMAVDGGAAVGGFVRELKAVYPQARVLCVEPRDDAQARLQAVAAQMSGVVIAQTLLGDHVGQVEFHQHREQSSVYPGSEGQPFGQVVRAPMTTLDQLLTDLKLPWPDLIKLDLQGAELQCLAGAPCCLEHAAALLLELSFLELNKGQPLLADLVGFLGQRGYQCYDVLGLWHRPLDGAMAQGDFLFLKRDHPLLADRRWSVDAPWN